MLTRPPEYAWKLAVLAGGDSPERAISLSSGDQVAAALRRAGHTCALIDPREIALSEIAWTRFDACVIALHGGAGEDGRVQAQLEQLGVAYTGSGPVASRLAMSKSASKERFVQAGVASPPYSLFHVNEGDDDLGRRLSSLGFPLVVKPDSQGSSVGLAFAAHEGELAAAVATAAEFDSFVLAEPFLSGREFTVGLLGREPLATLEIIKPGALFDYDAKYRADGPHARIADLTATQAAQIQDAALAAARSLGTRGIVRVDVILDDGGQVWVLEVNSVPGLTAGSLVPQAAAACGMDMSALATWMVRDALHEEVAL